MKQAARQLRMHMTDTENHLWEFLRKRQLNGALFRRQFVIEAYIVDFVCLQARLIIECDGEQHKTQKNYDQNRDEYLRSQGFNVLRFWNSEILQHIDVVLEKIAAYLNPPP